MATWQLLVGVAAVLVAAAAIIITIILALSKAVWTVSTRINDTGKATREKIDGTRKELSDESKEAHKEIGENIDALRREVREDRERTDGKIDTLSNQVGELRVDVARLVGPPPPPFASQPPADSAR